MGVKRRVFLGLFVYLSLYLYTVFISTGTNKMKSYILKDITTISNRKWTILMTVNDGYFDFFENWLHFYRKLEINYPLIVIAEDEIVFSKLRQLNIFSFCTIVRSWRINLNTAVEYGTEEFKQLSSGRPTYILRYLEKGLNIVYADTDSVWLHDPFRYFNGTYDMWVQRDGPHDFCTGLMAIINNSKTLNLLRMWETALKNHLDIDQRVFQRVYKNATTHIKLLDVNLFPSGKLYFEAFSHLKRQDVIIVHNNFIKGHENKLNRFKKFKLWFPN